MDKHMEPTVKYVDSTSNPLYAIKAYIAMCGAAASALLGVFAADSDIGKVLTVISVLATALATFKFPNAQVAEEQPYDIEDGYEQAPDTDAETLPIEVDDFLPWADER